VAVNVEQAWRAHSEAKKRSSHRKHRLRRQREASHTVAGNNSTECCQWPASITTQCCASCQVSTRICIWWHYYTAVMLHYW